MIHGTKFYTNGGAMCAAPLDILCEFTINAWGKRKSRKRQLIQKMAVSSLRRT